MNTNIDNISDQEIQELYKKLNLDQSKFLSIEQLQNLYVQQIRGIEEENCNAMTIYLNR